MSKRMNNIMALEKEIQTSDAYQIEGRLHTLKMNYFVFQKNYGSLTRVLGELQKTEIAIKMWDINEPETFTTVQYDIARRFLNFISSAMSLKSYTRHLLPRWYKNTDFIDKYNGKIEL